MRRAALIAGLLLTGCATAGPAAAPEVSPSASATPTEGRPAWGANPRLPESMAPDPFSVDPSTLDRKVMFGYQGWFACAGDGAPTDRWVHWYRDDAPTAANLTIDYWPDLREFDDTETCATSMTMPGGEPARVYSAWTTSVVVRHFAWMAEHNLDGVFLQRFTAPLADPPFFALRNRVAENVRAGAEAHERTFALMYDISGHDEATLVADIKSDWAYVTDTLKLTESSRYLHHNGRPAVAIWGLGFASRPGSPAQAAELIDYFQNEQNVTLIGGVPTYWRTLSNDSKTAAAWADVYRSFDVLSPWAVGRFATDAGADNFAANLIAPDLVEADNAGVDYMPVLFPGFSWANLNNGTLNQIPRRGGAFYWRQAFNAIDAGASMLYVAMFDEVDEGTAMFKMAPTSADLPVAPPLVPLDIDGHALPSDWYLQLARRSGQMLRGERPLTSSVPVPTP